MADAQIIERHHRTLSAVLVKNASQKHEVGILLGLDHLEADALHRQAVPASDRPCRPKTDLRVIDRSRGEVDEQDLIVNELWHRLLEGNRPANEVKGEDRTVRPRSSDDLTASQLTITEERERKCSTAPEANQCAPKPISARPDENIGDGQRDAGCAPVQRGGKQRCALGEGQLINHGLQPIAPTRAFDPQAVGLLEEDPHFVSHMTPLGDQHHAIDRFGFRGGLTITEMAATFVRQR